MMPPVDSFLLPFLEGHKKVAVIGLGYVGLPVALGFATRYRVIGYDIAADRIADLRRGIDPSREIQPDAFDGKAICFTSDPKDLREAHVFIIAVPTPIDRYNVPDLRMLLSASRDVASALKPGDYVIYESTVFPGCTEERCIPLLNEWSGLHAGSNYHVGYSPERILPGDAAHSFEHLSKVVSGLDEVTCRNIGALYGSVIQSSIYHAPSIKVAEAAKVTENIQRDLNIAMVNELAMVFDKLNIDTRAVLDAAATKWNFMPFEPGLVGGHCIGIDPYYMIHKALEVGIDPLVMRQGRRINDHMPAFIANKLLQVFAKLGKNPVNARVLILGLTFKEDVADIRNSRVVDLMELLRSYSISVEVTDPIASPEESKRVYGIDIIPQPVGVFDAVIVAVKHKAYRHRNPSDFLALMPDKPILFDLKGIYDQHEMEQVLSYWRL